MKELEIIYEAWGEFHKDNSELIHKWCEIDEFLYAKCSDEIREVIEDYLNEYGVQREQQAFIAGFKKAFHLFLDILNN